MTAYSRPYAGLCSRQACPLANNKYATVREQEGQSGLYIQGAIADADSPPTGALYLFMKTAERAHTPAKMWERVKLSNDYATALEQIDSELQYFPSFLKHKCKQRTTKIVQYLIKMRKLRTREGGVLVPVKKKLERREKAREGKALAAARLEKNLEKELVARLKSRAYGDMPLNVNEDVWKAVLDKERLEAEKEGEEALELEEDEDDLLSDELDEEDEEEGEFEEEREFIEDFEESDVEDLEDFDEEEESDEDEDGSEENSEDDDNALRAKGKGKRKAVQPKRQPPPAKKRRGAQVEIEYEMEGPARERILA